MHEMGIAQSILDAAREHVRNRSGASLRRIGLRIGELAGVDRESLAFSFECLVKDTDFEHVELAIEWCERSYRCLYCSSLSAPDSIFPVCDGCGKALELSSGAELEIAWLELEEAAP